MRALLPGLALGALLWLAPVSAQEAQNLGVVQSPVLTVEIERLINESAFGRRVAAELEAEGAAISAESAEIDAELSAEEAQLTQLRPTLEPAEFRELADAFNEKVERLRAEQDSKVRDRARRVEEVRRQLILSALPILESIMLERGATMVVERRAVILSFDAIDLTDEAITRLDETLGNGAGIDTGTGAQGQPPQRRPEAPAPAAPGAAPGVTPAPGDGTDAPLP